MKLSEAILLGDTLKSPYPHIFLAHGAGCALGGALLAVGHDCDALRAANNHRTHQEEVRKQWPWLKYGDIIAIGGYYFNVCNGEMTLEQLVDRVRSIEPKEEQETTASEHREHQEVHSVTL